MASAALQQQHLQAGLLARRLNGEQTGLRLAHGTGASDLRICCRGSGVLQVTQQHLPLK